MRVVEINTFGNLSTGGIACEVAEELNREGHECIVLYAREIIRDTVDSKRISSKLDVYGHALLARIFDSSGLHSKHSTKKVLKFLDEYKPDIVHIHNLTGYYVNYVMLFDYLYSHKEIKVVWTLHDTWSMTGHCCYFTDVKCEKWKTCCNKCPAKKTFPVSLVFDRSKKNYELKKRLFTRMETSRMMFVTPSDWLADLARQSYLKEFNIVTIHNGVDTTKFVKKEKSELYPGKKLLLGVANVWDGQKGRDVFLGLSRIIGDDWHIVLIGKFNDEIVLPPNVTHIERTFDLDELIKYYSSCDVLLNPTSGDNYPTVNVEAQCCGAKVLTFDTGGSKETDLGNLYLQENRDIHSIYESIKRVATLGVNEVDYEKASKIRMGKEYCHLFEKLMKEETL